MKIGLIGGTGFYDMFDNLEEYHVPTEYEETTIYRGKYKGKEVYFLPRHGRSHDVLAPYVHYRANMLALKKIGVDRILAVSAVGSINEKIPIGALSLLDQFVDITRRRIKTFGKCSVDMSEPFCPDLRNCFLHAARRKNIHLVPKATLVCVDGPIYETRAELQLFKRWGMDVVGMTNATEAILARELGMCYSAVTLTTDMATGFAEVPPDLATHKRVAELHKEKVKDLLLETLEILNEEKNCTCRDIFMSAVDSFK